MRLCWTSVHKWSLNIGALIWMVFMTFKDLATQLLKVFQLNFIFKNMKRNGSILLLSHIAVNLNLFLMFYHPLRICSVALLQLNPLRGEGAALLSWSRSMALKVRGGQSSSSTSHMLYLLGRVTNWSCQQMLL